MLKAIRENDRKKLMEGFIKFVILVENETDIQLANEVFELGLSYIMNTERDITEEELIRVSLERGDVVQSLAQRLVNKGKAEGRAEGRAENARKLKKAIKILIQQGVSIENIALAYQMSEEEVKQIIK
jgi:predicted transposase/invertase (TIGR01784 family)